MTNKYLKLFLFSLILIGSTIFLTGCSLKKDVEYDESKIKIVDLNDEDNSDDAEETTEEETTNEEEADTSGSPDVSDTDFSKFSRDEQTVGEENENEYSLLSLTDEELAGYHRFTFVIQGKDGVENLPYIVVDYRSTLGSIRVDLNGITSDSSGIAYQGSRSINTEGITRIYHNISNDQTEELYDIGVSESTPFSLSSNEVSAGKWNIVLDVKYPGESDLDIELGSTDFSTEAQAIVGAISSDGAAVTGYSFSVSGGQLVFIWTVTGSASKPIPSVSAELGGDGILDIVFESVLSDKVSSAVDDIELPSGIGFTYSDGAYHFEVGADSEFKLSASTSPNQVELTVKL